MKRCTFGLIALVMLGLLMTPLVAETQQAGKTPRLGYLALRAGPAQEDEVFTQGLRDLGWIEGQNLAIEYRWAAGKVDRLPALAEELVRLKVDLIVAWATPVVQAAKDATQTIPIVMTWVADPLGSGFVASLAQPGSNITGMSLMMPELAIKRLELLRELLPSLSRVAFLAHRGDPEDVDFHADDMPGPYRYLIKNRDNRLLPTSWKPEPQGAPA